jgi:hypothetical protein
VNRQQLEHVIRAAASIADDDEIVVIGSQAILGQFPDAPESLCVSMEADVFPRNHPERWDLVDGSIGEGSFFHETFGYYGQGVEEATAVLPEGWRDRLGRIQNENTRGTVGWTLEIHDLLVSKYVAGREKDRVFGREVFRHRLADPARVLERLAATDVASEVRRAAEAAVRQDAGAG